MRLYNQTKKPISWSMGAAQFSCEAWGSVEVPDELAPFVKTRGLPLDVAPFPTEQRAKQRVADEAESVKADAMRALRAQLDDAKSSEISAKEELGRVQVELSQSRERCRKAEAELSKVSAEVLRLKADKSAAEELLNAESARATEAETRAIKAEALSAEALRPDPPKSKKS